MQIYLFLFFLKSVLLVFLVVIIIQRRLGNSSKLAFSLSLMQQSNTEQPLKILGQLVTQQGSKGSSTFSLQP